MVSGGSQKTCHVDFLRVRGQAPPKGSSESNKPQPGAFIRYPTLGQRAPAKAAAELKLELLGVIESVSGPSGGGKEHRHCPLSR